VKTITYTLTETDKEFQTKIKTLVESGNSFDTQSIFTKIEIGILLVEMKLKNPIDFNSIIPESILPVKTRNRRMKLVLNKDCYFTNGMKITKDRKTTLENSKLLVVDNRVKNLTEKEISNIPNIYNGELTKINTMKGLTKSDWDTVIGGNDKPYENLMKKITDIQKTDYETKRDKHQPKGMDRDTFLDMVKNGIYPVIKSLHEFSIENTNLENTIKTLERKVKSLEKTKQTQLEKISGLNGKLEMFDMVSGNLTNIDILKRETV